MNNAIRIFSTLTALYLISACTTTMPSGPSVLVLPGTGKNFDQFRMDELVCRQFAFEQTGGTNAASVANDSGVRSAALGTLLGAAAGAAIDGNRGARVGAGTGLFMGGVAGAGAADISMRGIQQRYDFSYQQCMYAKGNRIPMVDRFTGGQRPPDYISPPPPGTLPPDAALR